MVSESEPVFEGDLSGRVGLLLADIRAMERDREVLLRELGEWRASGYGSLSGLRLAGLLHSAIQGRLGSCESFRLDSGVVFRPASVSGQFLLWVCEDVLSKLRGGG